MKHLPTEQHISFFKDRILVYLNSHTGKCIRIFTLVDGTAHFHYEIKNQRDYLGIVIHEEFDGDIPKYNWRKRVLEETFWNVIENERSVPFRLKDEELMLILSEEI